MGPRLRNYLYIALFLVVVGLFSRGFYLSIEYLRADMVRGQIADSLRRETECLRAGLDPVYTFRFGGIGNYVVACQQAASREAQ